MRNIKPKKSIEDYGGLQLFLDDPVVKASHNGKGYDDFKMYRDKGAAFLRDLFGLKTTGPIYRYFQVDNNEENTK